MGEGGRGGGVVEGSWVVGWWMLVEAGWEGGSRKVGGREGERERLGEAGKVGGEGVGVGGKKVKSDRAVEVGEGGREGGGLSGRGQGQETKEESFSLKKFMRRSGRVSFCSWPLLRPHASFPSFLSSPACMPLLRCLPHPPFHSQSLFFASFLYLFPLLAASSVRDSLMLVLLKHSFELHFNMAITLVVISFYVPERQKLFVSKSSQSAFRFRLEFLH